MCWVFSIIEIHMLPKQEVLKNEQFNFGSGGPYRGTHNQQTKGFKRIKPVSYTHLRQLLP